MIELSIKKQQEALKKKENFVQERRERDHFGNIHFALFVQKKTEYPCYGCSEIVKNNAFNSNESHVLFQINPKDGTFGQEEEAEEEESE